MFVRFTNVRTSIMKLQNITCIGKAVLSFPKYSTKPVIDKNKGIGKPIRRTNYNDLKRFIVEQYIPVLFNPSENLSTFMHANESKFEHGITLRILPSTMHMIPNFKGIMYYRTLLTAGKLLLLNKHTTRKFMEPSSTNGHDDFSLLNRVFGVSDSIQISDNYSNKDVVYNAADNGAPEGLKLRILSLKEIVMDQKNNESNKCLGYNVHDLVSDKLVVKWELSLEKIPADDNALNRTKETAEGSIQGRDEIIIRERRNSITGIFIFEFNAQNNKINVHTIDNVILDNEKENKEQDKINLLFF